MYLRKNKPRNQRTVPPNLKGLINEAMGEINSGCGDYEPFDIVTIAMELDQEVISAGTLIKDFMSLDYWMCIYMRSLHVDLLSDYFDIMYNFKEEMESCGDYDFEAWLDKLSDFEELFFKWFDNSAPDFVKYHVAYSDLYSVIQYGNTNTFYLIFVKTEHYNPIANPPQIFKLELTTMSPVKILREPAIEIGRIANQIRSME